MNGCNGNCNQGRKPCDCRFIPNDVAKCAGNPEHMECQKCLRYLLPVNPNSSRQLWMGPWIMDEPCPSRLRPE